MSNICSIRGYPPDVVEQPSAAGERSNVSTGSTTRARAKAVARERLAVVAEQGRTRVLAREDLVPLSAPLQIALGLEGLRRGSTLLVEGDRGIGATSFALALLAEATADKLWCAVVGPPDLGIVASMELGVDLDHLVVVTTPRERVAAVLGALVDGCDVLLLRLPVALTRAEMLRLSARVRQRRVLLFLLRDLRSHAAAWAEAPDITTVVHRGEFFGIADGSGRIVARRILLETFHRRGGTVAPVALWLPAPGGELLAEEVVAASRDDGRDQERVGGEQDPGVSLRAVAQ